MSARDELVPDRPTKLGRYELITRIGQGGMAEVQLAIQRGPAGFEKLVVVKLVHENLATQKTFVDMLLDEARVAALVKHPNVVDIYDLGEVDGRYYIAMEYLEGEPLLSVLRAGREGKRLDVMSTARLIADTAEGLDAAHELRSLGGDALELVHHDVSLGNIVVLYTGQVKLVDFGVAKATQSEATRSKVQGKFSYMAPEKMHGEPGDRRSDIFSLGCVLWEALTLKRLFRGGNDSETMKQVLESVIVPPSQMSSDVPDVFDPIVMRALEREPEHRYPTAAELAADLEDVLRQAQYPRRNDAIGKYMQDTFKDHIAARKKLLQEVTSKGTASSEILDLAFSEPVIAAGTTPGVNDFSVKFRRTTGAIDIPLPRTATIQSVPPPEPLPILPRTITNGAASGSQPLVPTDLARGASGQLPLAAADPDREPPAPRPPTSARLDTVPPDPRSRVLFFVLVLALLGAGAYVVLRVFGGGGRADEPVRPRAPSVAPAPVDAGALVAHAADAAPVESGDAAPPADPDDTPEAQTRIGERQSEHGDFSKAMASLKRAQELDPTFAPAWRELGKLHYRMGAKPEARAAFQKYLQMAPTAADASQIRGLLDKL